MRRHLSYANVAATLALVFSMTGGALAAKHYLINSTKQINPKVLKALRGNKGATGPIGQQGREGPPGQGAEGPAGKPGAIGKEGAPGATKIVTRYGPNVALASNTASESYAACIPGEAVTGGGFGLGQRPSNTNYYETTDRPSIKVQGLPEFPPPENGHAATGWLVSMENDTGFTFDFQAYVQCASP